MVLFNPLNWKLMQCNGSSVFMCCTELLQSCPALCDPIDCSLPGSSVHGILQAKILEWVAVPFSRGSSAPRDEIGVSYISCVGCWLFFLPFAPPGKLTEFITAAFLNLKAFLSSSTRSFFLKLIKK